MAFFDFLKGKGKAPSRGPSAESDTTQTALDELGAQLGGRPRLWHHFVSHVALREFALRGDGLPEGALNRPREFFAWILERMAPQLQIDPKEAPRLATDFSVHRQRINTVDATIVQMPAPEGPTECHFVCLVPPHANAEALRYFTLEDAGGGVTMLGAWDADQRHISFGEGPEPTLSGFVAAVAKRL